MNRDDIIRIAREAGMLPGRFDVWDAEVSDLERFAALVAAAERERILEMCKEGLWDGEGIRYHLNKRKDNT